MDGAFRRAVAEARAHRGLCFASLLSEDRILQAFGAASALWQGWIYTPAVTMWDFLSGVLREHRLVSLARPLNRQNDRQELLARTRATGLPRLDGPGTRRVPAGGWPLPDAETLPPGPSAPQALKTEKLSLSDVEFTSRFTASSRSVGCASLFQCSRSQALRRRATDEASMGSAVSAARVQCLARRRLIGHASYAPAQSNRGAVCFPSGATTCSTPVDDLAQSIVSRNAENGKGESLSSSWEDPHAGRSQTRVAGADRQAAAAFLTCRVG